MLRRAILVGVGVAVVAALVVFGLARNRSLVPGRAAPALPREQLVGPETTIPRLIASARRRPSVVVFWASWCGPCASEAPALERFADSPGGRGRIVGVDWSDALAGARSFVRHYAWTFPNVRDAEGTVGNAYHLTGLPTTFVLDARGHIRTVLRGPQSQSSLTAALARVEST